jgi:hypothetical protein
MYNYKEEASAQVRKCDAADCDGAGECRAPKNRQAVDVRQASDYFWFCQDHAREYNKKWDYFAGISSDEIMTFQKDAVTGHRPTWNYHIPPHLAAEAIQGRMRGMLGDDIAEYVQVAKPPISAKQQRALDVLELKHPVSHQVIRATYRKLVKQYHPDATGGDKAAEERFKQVGEAYRLLKAEYGSFVEG